MNLPLSEDWTKVDDVPEVIDENPTVSVFALESIYDKDGKWNIHFLIKKKPTYFHLKAMFTYETSENK